MRLTECARTCCEPGGRIKDQPARLLGACSVCSICGVRTRSLCHGACRSPSNRCSASGGGFCRDGGRSSACRSHTVSSRTGSFGDTGRADCTLRSTGRGGPRVVCGD